MSVNLSRDSVPGTAQKSALKLPESVSRARLNRMKWPIAGVAAVVAATAYIGAVDPNETGHYPICLSKLATGLDCPGCGGLRAVHSLANGDIFAALDHNLLAVLAFPLIILWAALALVRKWRGEVRVLTPKIVSRQRLLYFAFGGMAIVFTVARNLPFVPYLDSLAT